MPVMIRFTIIAFDWLHGVTVLGFWHQPLHQPLYPTTLTINDFGTVHSGTWKLNETCNFSTKLRFHTPRFFGLDCPPRRRRRPGRRGGLGAPGQLPGLGPGLAAVGGGAGAQGHRGHRKGVWGKTAEVFRLGH